MRLFVYMRMKLFYTIIIGLISTIEISAQQFILQGRVVNERMTPLKLVSVSVPRQGKVTFTSLKGAFRLQLKSADSVAVKFSMIGYKTRTKILIRPKGKQTLQVVLRENDNTLDEVTVKERQRQTGQTQSIGTADLNRMPSVSGNAVEELIQSQAGVSTHNELSAQYNVRGGSFDENSVYINHVEIHRPFLVRSGQQEGLSVINPNMVEKIGFSTGGFEAKYGDRMSSALDITYKLPKAFEASLSASLLGASAYAGFGNGHLAWSNGIRYKTNKYLLGSLQTKGEYKPVFLDYQTYLSYQPNKQWQIDFIGNISDNRYDFEPQDRETAFGTMRDIKSFRVYFDGQERDLFRTYFGSLSVKHNLGNQTSVALQASAFYTQERETYDIQGQYWLTQTESSKNLGVGTYFEHARNYLKARVGSIKLMFEHRWNKHRAEGALTLKREHISEHSAEYEMRDSAGYNIPHTGTDLRMIYSLRAKNTLDANRVEAYLQDTYRFTSPNEHTLFTLNYGIRFSHWNFNRETIVSPRLSLGVIPSFNHNMTWRLAAGLYYQAPFFKELRDTTTINGITAVHLNNKIKSQRSIHLIAGYDHRFNLGARPFKFTAEAYYKLLNNLVPYAINNMKVVYDGSTIGSGHATGLDLKLFGEFVPGTDSWLSLSVMNTRMKRNNRSIPLPTDQRFAVNLYFTDFFPGTTRWKMSLKLAYVDGLPFSAPHRELETNSFRAPAYKRADIGMSYRLLNNANGQRASLFKNIWLDVDCLNLFGISNVNSYYWVTDVTNCQYAVPNYLTGRRLNARITFEF